MLTRADIENAVRLDRATRLQSAASGLRSPDSFTGDLMADATFDMPPPSAGFDARGGWLLNRLMADLDLSPEQAAGIVGNLGGESGLEAIQERAPLAGRGGFGWEQATGPRRVAFEKWCADHNLNLTDDVANYGFLLTELRGSEAHALAQLRKTTSVEAAAYTFMVDFERPADPEGAKAARVAFANRALAASKTAARPPVAPPVNAPIYTPPVVHAGIDKQSGQFNEVRTPKLSGSHGTALGAGITAMLATVMIWATSWPLHAMDASTAMAASGLVISLLGLAANQLGVKISIKGNSP